MSPCLRKPRADSFGGSQLDNAVRVYLLRYGLLSFTFFLVNVRLAMGTNAEYYLLGYKVVQSIESQLMFWQERVASIFMFEE
jgi:hypothetical protein